LKRIGLLDPRYSHGFDDIDLCWRIWLSGYRVVSVPQCAVHHKVGGTQRKVRIDHALFHREKNRLMTAIKNYTLTRQFRVLPLILTFDFLQVLWFALRRRFLLCWAILRALTWDIRHFKYIWSEHLRVQYHVRKVSEKEILSHMLETNLRELWRRMRVLSAADGVLGDPR